MTTTFDLEQNIMNCWSVVDDLEVLNEAVLERDLKPDDISNILMGLKGLYHLKFEILFETFEKALKEKKI